jgi:purine-binding chemotaxis protein CheW
MGEDRETGGGIEGDADASGGLMVAVFEAAGGLLGIDSSRIEEVVRVPMITPVRGSSEYVLGIANLRGRIITVLDVSARLGLGRTAIGEDSRMLVATSAGESIGALVARLHDVVEINRSSLRSLAGKTGTAQDRFSLGVVNVQGKGVAFVDVDRVFATD